MKRAFLLVRGAAALAVPTAAWIAFAPVAAAPAADPGQRLFLQCQACHSLRRGEAHKLGPNLYGAIGRPAASRPGYNYSAALRQSGIRWDDATLDRWLQRPSSVVPGNKMIYSGMASPDQRRALIAYLNRATR